MRWHFLRFLKIGLTAAIFAASCCCSSAIENNAASPIPVAQALSPADSDRIELAELIARLRTSDSEASEDTRARLVALAGKTPDHRRMVVSELISAASHFSHDPEEYHLWEGAALTLGQLRADEALDVLARCFGCSNDLNPLHIESYPAALAVRQIGSPAIPQLKSIINSNRDRKDWSRVFAAKILADVGGTDEMTFLSEELKTETDPLVKVVITLAIKERRRGSRNP